MDMKFGRRDENSALLDRVTHVGILNSRPIAESDGADSVWGDRDLISSCPPMEDYAEAAE